MYRFIPKSRHDLTQGGKLQALQVRSKAGAPIVFQTASALTPDIKDLHTYGNVFSTGWVTVHDTDTDGFAVFNANALAKARSATPFKRPENGQFRPGTGFREFYFDETGDTLHAQRNALDSAWLFDVDVDYSNPAHQPVRLMAQGRDPSATIDSGLQGTPGFQNDGDNEITGFHVSDGDPSTHGILGARRPRPFEDGWRVFYTGQHGDNVTWEIVRAAGCDDDENENEGHHGDHR